ncbi:MAG: hypothetical protein K2W94_08170 [Alphaproteobacteria bacterium]|nr:hypothetical protein [Alphaproteobacteria bacterium]
MKIGETLIKTYTAQELYERYPNAEFLAPFNLSDFHYETADQTHRKKSKQKFQEAVGEKQLYKESKETSFLVKKSIALQKGYSDEEGIETFKKSQKNRIEVEKSALSREEKKERDNAKRRSWRAANHKKLLEKNKTPQNVSKQKTPLQKAEKTKTYNEAHREERREKSRAYHAANREKINARKRTQRAAKKTTALTSSSPKMP